MRKKLIEEIEKKIYSIVHETLEKIIGPDFVIDNVKDINLEFVMRLKSYGIGGIILDVDDTIRRDMMKIPECNQEWIKFMKREFRVVVVSNGYDGKVKEFLDENGIPYIAFAKKPLRDSFLKACEMMGLYPENVLAIGDDFICDIYGSKRCLMRSAVIKIKHEGRDF